MTKVINFEFDQDGSTLSGFRARMDGMPVNAQIFLLAEELLVDSILGMANSLSQARQHKNADWQQRSLDAVCDYADVRRIIREGRRLDYWFVGNHEIVIKFPLSGHVLKFELKEE